MAAEHADALARVEVPAARRPVVGTAEDEVPRTDDAVEQRSVTAEDVYAVARLDVPLADRLIGAACDHEVVLHEQTVDVILVAPEDADAFDERRLGSPQTRRTVLASRRQHRPILTEGHAVDAALVLL